MGNGIKLSPSFRMNPGGMSDVRILLVVLPRFLTSLGRTGVPSTWQQKGVSLPCETERWSWVWVIGPMGISGESDHWDLGDGVWSKVSTYMGDSGLPGSRVSTLMGMMLLPVSPLVVVVRVA